MSTTLARVLLGLVIAGIWLAVLPAVASADDCATRAARIAAGQVPSNEADPDCKKAGVIGTTVAVVTASTAVGVAAVKAALGGAGGAAQPPGGQPGQGGAGGPVVTGSYSGPEAIDILVKSGLATPVTNATGKPVWETDPTTGQPLRYPNGDPVPKVKPAAGFDNLGGNPVSRTVGAVLGPGDKPELVQTQTITGVTGFAGHTRPDGTIDPNVAITVNQSRPLDPDKGFPWVPPVEPPPPATTPPPQTPPQPPQTPPPQPPPQTPPQITVPVPPQTPPQPPQTPPPPNLPPKTAEPGALTSAATDTIKKINMARSVYNSKYTPAEAKEKLVDEAVKLTGLNREVVKTILGMSRENWAVVSGLIKSGAMTVDAKTGNIISLFPKP